MIRQIAPVFFTTDIAGTLAYYGGKLGFECVGTYGDPPFYAIVVRDGHAVHFRSVDATTAHPEKYAEELLAFNYPQFEGGWLVIDGSYAASSQILTL